MDNKNAIKDDVLDKVNGGQNGEVDPAAARRCRKCGRNMTPSTGALGKTTWKCVCGFTA